MAIVYITHNLGIVAELCDAVTVMCGGYVVEQGSVDDIFYHAAHPYTQMLHKAIPRMGFASKQPFPTVEGAPLDPLSPPDGCVFNLRCPSCMDICRRSVPPKISAGKTGHSAYCWILTREGDRNG
jgi:oligopeptide/dipeptide ABC transporter ATP-binding protein